MLADVEAHANAFVIHRAISIMLIQLAEKRKQFVHFCVSDASAIIYYMNY